MLTVDVRGISTMLFTIALHQKQIGPIIKPMQMKVEGPPPS